MSSLDQPWSWYLPNSSNTTSTTGDVTISYSTTNMDDETRYWLTLPEDQQRELLRRMWATGTPTKIRHRPPWRLRLRRLFRR